MEPANTGKSLCHISKAELLVKLGNFAPCCSPCFLHFCRNSSKKALTNDLIEGLEKDLERLKRFEENLRIRKLRTMKGGDKIINETDEDRYNAAIGNLQGDLEGRGAHILNADFERM